MATATHFPISVSEYLHTSYQPDCDYVDGVIEERNLGELDHAELQGALLLYLNQYKREWGIRTLPEIRVQTSPTRFRIADIAIVAVTAPREQIIQTPPVAIVEILSPEDRVPRYSEHLDHYRKMRVRNIWVVDPDAQGLRLLDWKLDRNCPIRRRRQRHSYRSDRDLCLHRRRPLPVKVRK